MVLFGCYAAVSKAFRLIFFLTLLSLCLCQSNYWREGINAVLTVDLDDINNYSLSINNTKWLIGGEPNVWCNNKWHSITDKTLQSQSSTPIKFNGNDNSLGPYNGIKMLYHIIDCKSSYNENNAEFEISFIYYSNQDIFVFTQSFPNGLQNTSITQYLNPPTGSNEFDVMIPITEFPVFAYHNNTKLHNDLGYIEWNGRQLSMINYGIGLNEFIGGAEGGPILLFKDGVKPTSSMVLSTFDNFMNGIFSIRTRRDGANNNNNNNGQCILNHNIDFQQNDVVILTNISSVDICCNKCYQYSYCNVFSYVASNLHCYLKYNDRGKKPVNGHISGYLGNKYNDYLVAGIEGNITSLPINYSISYVLSALENKGIHGAMEKWGNVLMDKYETNRMSKSSDLIQKTLGYWTDNGAYYQGKKPLNTSIAEQLFSTFKMNEIPIRYLQLDPYWYMGGSNSNTGIVWVPRTDLFPNGLNDLYNKIGQIPLLLYSSYWSPYKTVNYYNKNYNLSLEFANSIYYGSNNQKQISEPLGYDSSYNFYSFIVSEYNDLMVGFEVDFMDFEFLEVPQFLNGYNKYLNLSQEWTKGMNDAICNINNMYNKSISIQYCMSLPNYILHSISYDCVTNARASQDNVPTHHTRWKIAYTASFYSVLNISGYFDNIWTISNQSGNSYNNAIEPDVEMEAIISLLGAGPFGIGDAINMTNITIINRVIRKDGILLHPTESITPIDAMYYSNSSMNYNGNKPINGEVWMTYSMINQSIVSYYILAIDVDIAYNLIYNDLYPIPMNNKQFISYQFADNIMDIKGQCINDTYIEYCDLIIFDNNYPLKIVTSPTPQNNVQHLHSWNLYVVALKQENGWYILGEMNKYVSISPDRFISIQTTMNPNGIKCVLSGAQNEIVVINFVSDQNNIIQIKVKFNENGDNQTVYVHS